MDRAEKVTKLILEAILPAKLEYRPEQSHGEYDFYLKYQDGRLAALEATATVDQAELELLAAIKRQTKGRAVFSATKCKHSWMISVRSSARINVLRQRLDTYLSALEHDGISSFSESDIHNHNVKAICIDLAVEGGCVISTSAPPRIYPSPAGKGELISHAGAVEAARREAWKEDNRRKLGDSNTPERHLAIYVDVLDDSAWTAMHWSEPPPIVPDLPAEITHIWLFAEGESSSQYTIWCGRTDRVWRSQRLRLPATSADKEA